MQINNVSFSGREKFCVVKMRKYFNILKLKDFVCQREKWLP